MTEKQDNEYIKDEVLALKRIFRGTQKSSEEGLNRRVQLLNEKMGIELRKSERIDDQSIVMKSVWHVLASLLLHWYASRFATASFKPKSTEAIHRYGRRPIYRGQARPWSISPLSRRPENKIIRALKERPLKAFKKVLDGVMKNNLDVPLGFILPSQASDEWVKAIAQHYGFPTSLVDFTFDPMTAIHFALGRSDSGNNNLNGPKDHAVIFTASFRALKGAALLSGDTNTIVFPPVVVDRLYAQTGFFMDYDVIDNNQKDVSSNVERLLCQKIYFPRTYPDITDGKELREEGLEQDEPFFTKPLSALEKYCNESHAFDDEEAYTRTLLSGYDGPLPWPTQQDIPILTDDYIAHSLRYIKKYLMTSSLINVDQDLYFDPVVIDSMLATNEKALQTFKVYAESISTEEDDITQTWSRIKTSVELIDKIGKMREGHHLQ